MNRFLLIVFLPLMAICQVNETNKLPNVLPSNPKAYEFTKYADVPVSKYTGVPSITVPVYTIKAKGLDIPITLSYHSNGVKVNEEAGWTGLGWNLDVGGSIIQVVNGFDDFGYYAQKEMPDFEKLSIYTLPSSAMGTCQSFVLTGRTNAGALNGGFGCSEYERIEDKYVLGYADTEPDIFKFNVLGYSGEFALNWETNQFICLSDSKVKIFKLNATGAGIPNDFVIAVPDGHRFLFTLKEETAAIHHSSVSEEHGPSFTIPSLTVNGEKTSRLFQLTQIVTKDGDTILFDYFLTSEVVNIPNISKQFTIYTTTPGFPSLPPGMNEIELSRTCIVTQQKLSYLKKITYNGGRVDFLISDRVDFIGSKKLDKIEIRKDASTSPVKSFEFLYDYFVGHTSGANMDEYLSYMPIQKTTQELTHRLKLLSVKEIGSNAYLFDYNTTTLPKKTSLASDYWGFYSGINTNTSLFPNVYQFNVELNDTRLERFASNDKGASLEYTKAAVLEKVTYPHKGFVTFDYELNSFDNYVAPPQGTGASQSVGINSRSLNGMPTQKAVILKGENTTFRGNAMLSSRGCTDPNAYSGFYVKIEKFKEELVPLVENNEYGTLYAMATLGIFSNSTIYNQYIEDVIYIQKAYNDPEEKFYNDLEYTFGKGVVLFSSYGGCGTYNGTTNSSQTHLALSFRDYGDLSGPFYGAGLRVKNIKSYSTVNDLMSVKSFSYDDGKLMAPLIFINKTTSEFEYSVPNGTTGSCTPYINQGYKLTFSASSFATPSAGMSGKYVGYGKVTEKNNGVNNNVILSSDNGTTTSYFRNVPDTYGLGSGNGVDVSNAVTLPPVKSYPENGLLIKEEYKDASNNLIKSIENTYQYIPNNNCFYGLRSGLHISRLVDNVHDCYTKCHVYHIGAYPIKIDEPSLLMKKVETDYFTTGLVRNEQIFDYNDLHQMVYNKEIQSNSYTQETSIFYPKDLSGISQIATQMLNSNVLNVPLKKEIKINGDIITTEEYQYYKRLGSNNNPVMPDVYSLVKVKATKSGNDLEDKIIYEMYDNFGNPLQIKIPEGITVTYIWGYNGQYPIAKIENAAYSSVSSYVSSLQSLSNSDNSRTVDTVNSNGTISYVGTEGSLRQALNNLRNLSALSGAQVTTYTYDPLIGITSITDPSGMVVYYHYDAQGRLQYIKDADGLIMEQYQYHYKDQN